MRVPRIAVALVTLICVVFPIRTEEPVVYVKAGRLVDVEAGEVLEDRVIVIRGERIAEVAAASNVQIGFVRSGEL